MAHQLTQSLVGCVVSLGLQWKRRREGQRQNECEPLPGRRRTTAPSTTWQHDTRLSAAMTTRHQYAARSARTCKGQRLPAQPCDGSSRAQRQVTQRRARERLEAATRIATLYSIVVLTRRFRFVRGKARRAQALERLGQSGMDTSASARAVPANGFSSRARLGARRTRTNVE